MIDARNFKETLNGKPVAVFGLGISNGAAVKILHNTNIGVTAWDDCEERRTVAEKEGVCLKDLTQEDLSTYACLVLAPGVPLYYPEPHPVVVAAGKAGIEIICDLEILHRCNHGRTTIGITGTNGKSTTTALIGHILNECGISAVTGGNIGHAALDMVLPPENGVIVLEVSSFQMDLCPGFTPDIAVHLNVSSDHLERHGSMEEYVAAKKRLFEGAGRAVIGMDDEYSRKMFEDIKKAGTRDIYPVSATDNTISSVDTPALSGVHNRQNAAAAYVVAKLIGLEPGDILNAMETFPGLQHRQYPVRVINGVAWVNDSKATNADATEKALACYKKIYWIVGGRPKGGGLEGLESYLDCIEHAFLIGETTDAFSKYFDKHGVAYTACQTLDRAITAASAKAPHGSTVLLSPACASFDQFSSFEERGNVFTALVQDLKEEAA